jgi:hypothetical protein
MCNPLWCWIFLVSHPRTRALINTNPSRSLPNNISSETVKIGADTLNSGLTVYMTWSPPGGSRYGFSFTMFLTTTMAETVEIRSFRLPNCFPPLETPPTDRMPSLREAPSWRGSRLSHPHSRTTPAPYSMHRNFSYITTVLQRKDRPLTTTRSRNFTRS